MGKGDKKTKRGKIVIGSYGVKRPRKKKGVNPEAAASPTVKKAVKTAARPKAASPKAASPKTKPAPKKTAAKEEVEVKAETEEVQEAGKGKEEDKPEA